MTQPFVVVVTGNSVVLAQQQRKCRFSHFIFGFCPHVQVSDVKPGRNSGLIHLLSCYYLLDRLHLLNKLLVYFPTA